jgi:hypothetical protein
LQPCRLLFLPAMYSMWFKIKPGQRSSPSEDVGARQLLA